LDDYISISGTSAWVWTNPAYLERRINICPIVYFLGDDISDDTSDLSSRVGTLFHELTHFTDMGDTGDYSYDNSVMLAAAASYPSNGDWMGNAASWDNFSEDIAQYAMNWADFCGDGDDCSDSSSDTDITTTAGSEESPITDSHYVSTGRADDTSTMLADDDDLYAVRCASDSDRSADGWRIKTSCGIYYESDVWSEGCQILSFPDAEAFCIAQGGRLPTLTEIEDNCVQGSGCQYDSALIWSSTEYTTISLYDSPTNMPTAAPNATPNEHYVSTGRANSGNTQLALDDDIYAVRCACDSDRTADGWRIKSACSIWYESDVWTEGCVTKSFSDAEAFCAAQGGRLPTLAEIEAGCVQGSGCQYDSALIWSSTASTLETKVGMKNIIQEALKTSFNISMQVLALIGAWSILCFAKSFAVHLWGKQYQEIAGQEEV